jgi:hypothetical protein
VLLSAATKATRSPYKYASMCKVISETQPV